MSLGHPLLKEVCGDVVFLLDGNEEFYLEVSIPCPIKAMDPFLHIQKKIGHVVNLDAVTERA